MKNSYMPTHIEEIVNQYKSNINDIDISKKLGKKGKEGNSFQNLLKYIFTYNANNENIDIYNSEEDHAFIKIKMGERVYPRIIWFKWFQYIFLHGNFILSQKDRRKKIKGKIVGSGPYLKIIIKNEVLNVFQNFMENVLNMPLGKEGKNSKHINFKDLNEKLKVIDPKHLENSNEKIICGRFKKTEENTLANFLYKQAENKFDALANKIFGENINQNENIKKMYQYYENLGLNLIPIDCKVEYQYNKINEKTNHYNIKKQFEKDGIQISETIAKKITLIIRGITSTKNVFTDANALGFKKFYIGKETIPTLKENSAIVFNLTSKAKSKRIVDNQTKRKVLEKYEYQPFNKKNGEFYKKIKDEMEDEYQNKLNYMEYLIYISYEKLYKKEDNKKEKKKLLKKIDCNKLNKFKIDIRETFNYHHLIFVDTLMQYAEDGFNLNLIENIVPMTEYEHRMLHQNCKNEYDTIKFMIEKEWIKKTELYQIWKKAIIAIKNEEKRIGEKTKVIAYLKTIIDEDIYKQIMNTEIK